MPLDGACSGGGGATGGRDAGDYQRKPRLANDLDIANDGVLNELVTGERRPVQTRMSMSLSSVSSPRAPRCAATMARIASRLAFRRSQGGDLSRLQ
jgi:hypothetical protein